MLHSQSFFPVIILDCIWGGLRRICTSSKIVVPWQPSQIFSQLLVCFSYLNIPIATLTILFWNGSLSQHNCILTLFSLWRGGDTPFASFLWAVLSSWKNLLGTPWIQGFSSHIFVLIARLNSNHLLPPKASSVLYFTNGNKKHMLLPTWQAP